MSKYAYWKYAERSVAKKLGGRRIVEKGIQTHDVETDWLVVEVKTRKKLPQWLTKAVALNRIKSPDNKLPVVILKSPSVSVSLVIMDLTDFKDWFD